MRFRRLFFWGTILPGAAAVYLMMKHGKPFGASVKQAVAHPIGSLVTELRHKA